MTYGENLHCENVEKMGGKEKHESVSNCFATNHEQEAPHISATLFISVMGMLTYRMDGHEKEQKK